MSLPVERSWLLYFCCLTYVECAYNDAMIYDYTCLNILSKVLMAHILEHNKEMPTSPHLYLKGVEGEVLLPFSEILC